MPTLPRPVICKCGFNTMDAEEAIRHLEERHPECWKDEDKYAVED